MIYHWEYSSTDTNLFPTTFPANFPRKIVFEIRSGGQIFYLCIPPRSELIWLGLFQAYTWFYILWHGFITIQIIKHVWKIGKHLLPPITLGTNVTAKQCSVDRKWIRENHPKAVSKPPIQKLLKFTFKILVFVLQYIK